MDKDLAFGLLVGAGGALRAQENALIAGGDAHTRTAEAGMAMAMGLQQARNKIAELESRIAQLEMTEAGYQGVVGELRRQHPASPLVLPSGQTFDDGTPKQGLHLIFAAGFDRKGAEMGIGNPAEWRAD